MAAPPRAWPIVTTCNSALSQPVTLKLQSTVKVRVDGGAGGGDVLYDVVDGGGLALFGRRSSEAARLLGIISPGGQIPALLSVLGGGRWWRETGGGRSARQVFDRMTKSRASEAAAQELEALKLDMEQVNNRTEEIGTKLDGFEGKISSLADQMSRLEALLMENRGRTAAREDEDSRTAAAAAQDNRGMTENTLMPEGDNKGMTESMTGVHFPEVIETMGLTVMLTSTSP
ncbi:hypothetical protein QYE76_033826 [Lolium multiflorum]|uniref:Uncharacterized protein n=2 Tax=Lolium multiflorum TaxID=4521 RepID=A0AAD8QZV2_LOLMU|nr:hypothetical protein QYE76_033826 [Lolium multiflorum]